MSVTSAPIRGLIRGLIHSMIALSLSAACLPTVSAARCCPATLPPNTQSLQTTNGEAVRALTLAHSAALTAGEVEKMREFWN